MLIVCPTFLGHKIYMQEEHPPEHSGLNSATFTAQEAFYAYFYIKE